MKILKIPGLLSMGIIISLASCNSGGNKTNDNTDSSAITINLKEMKHIGTVDEFY